MAEMKGKLKTKTNLREHGNKRTTTTTKEKKHRGWYCV